MDAKQFYEEHANNTWWNASTDIIEIKANDLWKLMDEYTMHLAINISSKPMLADSFLPTLDKKNFRQCILGMMMQELDVPFDDMPKLLKLQKCTQEIIRFAEEHHLLEKNLR